MSSYDEGRALKELNELRRKHGYANAAVGTNPRYCQVCGSSICTLHAADQDIEAFDPGEPGPDKALTCGMRGLTELIELRESYGMKRPADVFSRFCSVCGKERNLCRHNAGRKPVGWFAGRQQAEKDPPSRYNRDLVTHTPGDVARGVTPEAQHGQGEEAGTPACDPGSSDGGSGSRELRTEGRDGPANVQGLHTARQRNGWSTTPSALTEGGAAVRECGGVRADLLEILGTESLSPARWEALVAYVEGAR